MEEQGQLHTSRRTFGKTPEQLMHDMDITDGAVRLYAHMHWRYGSNKQNFEGQKSMAEMMGVTETTISNRIRELEANDWVLVIERGINKGTGAFQTPFYHVFEQQRDCREFRRECTLAEGETLRLKPKKSRKRKARKGVGGNPKLHPPNLSSAGDPPNLSSDGATNSSSDGLPNLSSDNPDASYPDSVHPEKKDSAPNGAVGDGKPVFKKIEPDAPIFNKDRVFDVLAFVCCGIKDMRDVNKPLIVKGKEKDNPAGAKIGKIKNWLLQLYPEKDEPFVAEQVRKFYYDTPEAKRRFIPQHLEGFTTAWLKWYQKNLPAPKLDVKPEYTDELLPGAELE